MAQELIKISLEGKDFSATGVYLDNNHVIIYRGSKISDGEGLLNESAHWKRYEFLDHCNSNNILTEDFEFDSPSTCFTSVSGYHGNADDIKTNKGISLKQYIDQRKSNSYYPLNRVLFCNIAWMEKYSGTTVGDKQHSGAKYIKETGNGFEKFNFADFGDEYQYGFVETKYVNGVVEAQGPNYKKFNLSQFGEEFKNAESADGILVIFCSQNPTDNQFCIVGYYKNASVFKNRQIAPDVFEGEQFQYNLRCLKEDAVLIPADKRLAINCGIQLFHRQLFFYPSHKDENSQIYEKIVGNLIDFDKNQDYSKLQVERHSWVIPCSPAWYDIDGVMREIKVCWFHQVVKDVSVGDIVYIYVSAPQMQFKYRCLVEKVGVPLSDIDQNEDKRYVHSFSYRINTAQFMRLKLIDVGSVELSYIKENCSNYYVPQGQSRLTGKYLEFIENNFETITKKQKSLADQDDSGEEESYDSEISSTPAEEVIKDGVLVFPRNERTKRIALANANDKCAIEGCSHELFKTKSGRTYLEVHHLIPISARKDFPGINIDIPENAVCLCPSCHREIHNGENAKELIEKLYEQRKTLLESKGIIFNNGITQLLSYYNIK